MFYKCHCNYNNNTIMPSQEYHNNWRKVYQWWRTYSDLKISSYSATCSILQTDIDTTRTKKRKRNNITIARQTINQSCMGDYRLCVLHRLPQVRWSWTIPDILIPVPPNFSGATVHRNSDDLSSDTMREAGKCRAPVHWLEYRRPVSAPWRYSFNVHGIGVCRIIIAPLLYSSPPPK